MPFSWEGTRVYLPGMHPLFMGRTPSWEALVPSQEGRLPGKAFPSVGTHYWYNEFRVSVRLLPELLASVLLLPVLVG